VGVPVMNRQILQGDALDKLKEIDDNSVDLIATDPSYGYSFMNKDWDKALASVAIWKECLRVLKPGAFAFVMSAPRQDVLSRVIVNLSDAGFKTDFTSIYWAYASGFTKAANISKLIDKRYKKRKEYDELGIFLKNARINLNKTTEDISKFFPSKTGGLTGCVSNWENALAVPTITQWIILKRELNFDNSFDWLIEQKTKRYEAAEREITGIGKQRSLNSTSYCFGKSLIYEKKRKSATNLAKKLDGSYAGFQPKPAVEVILVCMKPLSEKSYTEQAMSNGKGITWLDDCRIPSNDKEGGSGHINFAQQHSERNENHKERSFNREDQKTEGRFPANLLVSDDALNDGKVTKGVSGGGPKEYGGGGGWDNKINRQVIKQFFNDSGSFSRYFDLDSWEAQFIITPKASKSEKNKGLDNFIEEKVNDGREIDVDNPFQRGKTQRQNIHPTVKPVSLFKYLITMGSREGDLILDPFMGSGTTAIACEQIARDWIGIEKIPEYVEIFKARLADYRNQNKMEEFL